MKKLFCWHKWVWCNQVTTSTHAGATYHSTWWICKKCGKKKQMSMWKPSILDDMRIDDWGDKNDK